MTTYTTIQGDTWDMIAFKVYGKETMMSPLIVANPEQANTVIFPAGIILALPAVPVSVSENLPPWKRSDSV